jgi:heme oxygenase
MDSLPPLSRSGLAMALRHGTAALHSEAEHSGIVQAILRRRASLAGYALLLRNLLPIYRTMERALRRLGPASDVAGWRRPELYRAEALAGDLTALAGPRWPLLLPLLPAGRRYAARVRAAAAGRGTLLIAHAYTRYLGDVSGGQVLRRLLGGALGLGPGELRFYDFPAVADPAALRDELRAALDLAGAALPDPGAVIAEAQAAFRLNIALSRAVLAAAQAPGKG